MDTKRLITAWQNFSASRQPSTSSGLPTWSNSPPVTPYQGLDHFGLTVKDIDAVAAEIKAKGVEFTREPTTIRPGVRICFIRGPQGISIELLERDQKYA